MYPSYLTEVARKLRRRSTQAEAILWTRVRNRRLGGFKFKRQHRVGRFVVDFYCSQLKLVVELEGGIHDNDEQKAYDASRFEELEKRGLQILRIRNEEVLSNVNGVLNKILALSPSPLPRVGEGNEG